MKTVIIISMVGPYEGDPSGCEVWGLNRTYIHTTKVDRQYFFDKLDVMTGADPSFIDQLNALDCPVYTVEHVSEIPRSEPYPLSSVIGKIGIKYFTSTVAYMIAHAIVDGFERIVLSGMMPGPDDTHYWEQKDNLDFWCGYAAGKGIEVHPVGNSQLMRPWPWQSSAYGYEAGNPAIKDIIAMGFRQIVEPPKPRLVKG